MISLLLAKPSKLKSLQSNGILDRCVNRSLIEWEDNNEQRSSQNGFNDRSQQRSLSAMISLVHQVEKEEENKKDSRKNICQK